MLVWKSSRHCGDVVQLVRTPACHVGGRGFEPRRPRHSFQSLSFLDFGFFWPACSRRELDAPFTLLLASFSTPAIRSTVRRLRSSRRCWYRRNSRLLCPVNK